MCNLIETSHLTKRYGGLTAVDDVTLTVKRGDIVGLVGKNGAGKTTLIRILTGLVKPSGGTFSLMPGQTRTDTTVAAIVERPSLYNDMTSMNNLRAQSILLGIKQDDEYLRRTLELVGLDPSLKQRVKNYSLGMKQRLAIAMTLVGKPELLILDEPINGLDPQGIHDLREIFVKLNREFGITIVVSSHILSELSKFATVYIFMDHGRVIKQISAEELESAGSKRLRVTVDDVDKAKEALQRFGKVEIVTHDSVELYGDTPATEVLLCLSQEGVVTSNIVNVGDNLEEFFIGLVGGAQ